MKHWFVRSRSVMAFGAEVEVVEDLGTTSHFSERHGDFDVDHLLVRTEDGEEHHAEDYELVPAGDWNGAASRYRFDRGRELRDDVGDILMREKTRKFGTTAPAIAAELKLDIGFTRLMLARLRQFNWAAEDADMLWFPAVKLVERREAQERKREEERQALERLLAQYRK